ncbi:methyltransferase [Leucobacter sp. USCH14]|uniref:class I SAM-dependent methyltransferase n=1 Tax=Leucobacter sp. USCH14 TaxID=3024838 RepID=UPI0030B53519
MNHGSPDEHFDEHLSGLFAQLTREPDFDADELQAFDAADHLILRSAVEDLAERPLQHPLRGADIVVIGDRHGALTLGAATVFEATGIRTHQDPLLGERALAQNAGRLGLTDRYVHHPLDAALLTGARLVLLQLPRGLEALAEISEAIARWADPEVRVFAGGRVKHMTRAMNDVLGRDFTRVTAGLGWRKSRVLRAESRRERAGDSPSFPKWGSDSDLDFSIAAFGATFGGPVLDHGSRLLLGTLAHVSREPATVIDLGCGNGVLAVSAALRFPGAQVLATDQSAAAVAATRLTAGAAGVADRVAVDRSDALEAVPDEWADLILLNPPFHTGATVHAGVGHRLIRSCRRALAPGGELRLVFNSHLRYRPLVEREVGPVRQLARTAAFTVLSASRVS